jgi:hypothetical protein
MPKHPTTINLSSFKGLSNVHRPEDTPEGYLTTANNVDINKIGTIAKRKGYTLKLNGNVTSLWSSSNGLGCYTVINEDLVRVLDDYSTVPIKLNIGSIPLSFEEVDDVIYFMSPVTRGSIINGAYETWGLNKNNYRPMPVVGSGTLPAGTYQISYSYINNRGIESGTGLAASVTVLDNSSITIHIPALPNPKIVSAKIYCSTADGTELYFIGKSPLGSTYLINDVSRSSYILRVFNLDAPPLGHIVKYYKGRLYIADKHVLYYSNPFQYHHFDLGYNYMEFSSDIIEILPVEDGIWVCSDTIAYLSGDNPTTFTKTTKEYISVVKGTSTRFSGSYLKVDNTPSGYKWLVTTELGIFALFNNGIISNLTSDHLSLNKASSGTSLFVQSGGNNQYLSILKTNDKPNNSVMGDLVEATIVRNGVIIQ